MQHEITTKEKSVKAYRETKDIEYLIRKYHVSKASLMRWNKLYDEARESLIGKSHRPHSPHPNAHMEEELKWIIQTDNGNEFTKFRKTESEHIFDALCSVSFRQIKYRQDVKNSAICGIIGARKQEQNGENACTFRWIFCAFCTRFCVVMR